LLYKPRSKISIGTRNEVDLKNLRSRWLWPHKPVRKSWESDSLDRAIQFRTLLTGPANNVANYWPIPMIYVMWLRENCDVNIYVISKIARQHHVHVIVRYALHSKSILLIRCVFRAILLIRASSLPTHQVFQSPISTAEEYACSRRLTGMVEAWVDLLVFVHETASHTFHYLIRLLRGQPLLSQAWCLDICNLWKQTPVWQAIVSLELLFTVPSCVLYVHSHVQTSTKRPMLATLTKLPMKSPRRNWCNDLLHIRFLLSFNHLYPDIYR